jgi:hypothetical protein
MLLGFGLGQLFGQWTVYTCDVTPNTANPAWGRASVTEGVTDGASPVLCSVVDDPDITGNKLLMIEELVGDKRESWKIFPLGGFADSKQPGKIGTSAEDWNRLPDFTDAIS